MSDMKTNKGKQVLEKSDKSKLTEIQLRWLGMFSKTVSEKEQGNEGIEEIPEEFKKLETAKKIELDKVRLGEVARNGDEAGYQAVLKDVGPRLATALKAVGKKKNDKVKAMEKLYTEAKEHAVKKEFKEASDKLIEANTLALEVLSGTVGHQDISTGDRKNLVEAKRGDKYEKEGFFVGTGVDEGGGQHHASRPTVRTRMYDDKLREEATVYKDDEGYLTDKDGKRLTTKPKGGSGNIGEGYVTDPKTGEIYKFKEDKQTKPSAKTGFNTLLDHHSSPVEGKNVAAAGMDKIEKGIVRKVTGESGHYTPGAEHVYQQVRGFEDQGVKMRSEKLTKVGKDGKRMDVDKDTQVKWDKVKQFPGKAKDGDDPKNVSVLTINKDDPEEIKNLKKELQDMGVGLDYVDAKAEVYRSTAFLSEEEKTGMTGQDALITVSGPTVTGADTVAKAVVDQVIAKLGWDKKWPTDPQAPKDKDQFINSLESEIIKAKKADPTKKMADILNGYIGLRMRVRWDNPEVTRLTQDVSAFGQTGGNIEAIDAKSKMMEELKSKVKETAPAGEDITAQLGKLLKLPENSDPTEVQKKLTEVLVSKYEMTNPGNFTQEEAYVILAKGRVPLEFQIKDLGGDSEVDKKIKAAGMPPEVVGNMNSQDRVDLLKTGNLPDARWFDLLGGDNKVEAQLNKLVPHAQDPGGPWGEYGAQDADFSGLTLQEKIQIAKAKTYNEIQNLIGKMPEQSNARTNWGSGGTTTTTPTPTPSKVDIGRVKKEDKLTSDQLSNEDKEYRDLGGDEALLDKRRKVWQEKHKKDLARILELQKAIPKTKEGKSELEGELQKLLKIVKEDDPMPTLGSIVKERKQKESQNKVGDLVAELK